MSRCVDPCAKPLPFEDWPRADRKAFLGATQVADVFETSGRAAHLAPVTIKKYRDSYGRWLKFLELEGLLTRHGRPRDRATPVTIKAYVVRLQQRLLATSVWSYLLDLHNLLYHIEPNSDWSWLRRIVNRLNRLMPNQRVHQGDLMDIGEIYHRGLAVARKAERRRPRRPLQNELRFRDGLILALLATAPLRAKNFAGLRLGKHLQRLPEGWVITVAGDETKNGQSLDFSLPDALMLPLDRYTEIHRPRLLQGKNHDFLWVNLSGNPIKANKLGQLVSRITLRELDKRLTPHRFRDCAATTIATVSPELAPIIQEILGHTTAHTAEQYYNKASVMEAGRRHAAAVDQWRRDLASMGLD